MKNKNLFIIIQARMTSTRLPKKVMLPLCDKKVLEIVIDRLNKYKKNIIIATTDDSSSKPISDLCESLDIKYYKGSTGNVLERYYLSADKYNAKDDDIIVRITSDCPLIDQSLMEKVINMFIDGNFDYVSNRINRTIPVGLDVEVFSFAVLKESYINAKEEFEKEHVTPYIYLTNKDKYKIGSCEEKEDNSKYRLTLDEELDYKAIKEVYSKFENKIDFSYEELILMLKDNNYIYEINSQVYQKSAKE